MKYSQKREASEEVLRLVIQRMAAHPASFTPHTYAVWYEHTLGINPGLSAEINQLLDGNGQLDDDTVSRLYERHVSEGKQGVDRILREDMKHLLGKLIEVTAETDKRTQSFGNSLKACRDELHAKPDATSLRSMIDRMASDADAMHGSMFNLHSELEHSEEKLGKLQQELESARREALIDPLTGIYNRRGFEIQVQGMLADATSVDRGLCLLMVDIDHFKMVNDSYGHLFGDKVIRTLANMLKSKIKGQDSVARLGGEEFAVLLPETTLPGARTVAEQIRANIEQGHIRRLNSQNQIGGITVSIGIAAYHSGSTLVEWLDQADKALYVSKENGRNQVTVYEPSKAS